jgi:hypothetical protein
MMAGELRDLGLGPALLVEVVNGGPIHEIQHPVRRPSARSCLSARDGSGQAQGGEGAAMGCRFLNWKSADSYAVVYIPERSA